MYMQSFVIFIATLGLIYPRTLNKSFFFVAFPLLIVECTRLIYFCYAVNISLTAILIDLLLVNDLRTCLEVTTTTIFFLLSRLAGVMIYLLQIPVSVLHEKIGVNIVFALISVLLCLPVIYVINNYLPFTVGRRKPKPTLL